MDNPEQYEQTVFQALYARRSVRWFQDQPVEPAKITRLLQAAMAAPSACNIQPWHFVVVAHPGRIARLKATCAQYGDYNTPLILAVCGDNSHIPWKDQGIIDCALAMENIMIAAPALGLGTVCIGGFDRPAVKELLGLPPEVAAVGLIYVGYPREHKAPRTRYLAAAVHQETWDAGRPNPPRPGNIIEFGPEASL